MLMPMGCSNGMRRLTLLISVALAMLTVAIPATASAKRSHHRSHRARVADRNHNGIPDSWERKYHVRSATADPDHDGVTNLGEFHNGTNPRSADTNGNGIPDGQDDSNHDGVPDGQEQAGTIASFDTTTNVLTITLVNGDTQKGTVDPSTEIECDNPATTTAPTTATTRDGGGDQSSTDTPDTQDSQQSTDQQSGDQQQSQSGENETQGDDDQGSNDDQGDSSSSCGTADLVAGTIVKEAELSLTSGGAIFHKIDLGGKAPA
jgi:hypothetical protein